MPVSSVASRRAPSHGVSPASTWPPGWTQMPRCRWRSRTMPRGPTMNAEPVTWTGPASSSNGRASVGTVARMCVDAVPLALVDGVAGGDLVEDLAGELVHASSTGQLPDGVGGSG